MNNGRTFLIAILLITALGCVVPGLSTPTAAPPVSTSTADNRLPTMVAATFAAAMTQTLQAIPPTLTPTSTPEPPMPTVTSTATLSISSTLTALENASTFFTDERGGYTLTIPQGWLVVRVNQQEFLDALSMNELSEPLVYGSLKKVQNEDPNVLRLFAVDTQDETAQGEPVTTIKMILDETRGISFNSDQDLQAIADELTKATPGLEVTAVDILITPAGMQFGAIESATTAGDGAVTYEKRVYFKVKAGVAYAWLTTGASLKESIIPAFDAIMDTIRLPAVQ